MHKATLFLQSGELEGCTESSVRLSVCFIRELLNAYRRSMLQGVYTKNERVQRGFNSPRIDLVLVHMKFISKFVTNFSKRNNRRERLIGLHDLKHKNYIYIYIYI
jgi:hypothetical protein